MENEITNTVIYNESTDKPPTSLTSPVRVKQTLKEISDSLDNIVDRNDPNYSIHALGKMYRNSLGKNGNSSYILNHFLNCYYELLIKELEYNNGIEKIEIIKKSIQNIQNTFNILEKMGYECDGEKMKTLLRAFSV